MLSGLFKQRETVRVKPGAASSPETISERLLASAEQDFGAVANADGGGDGSPLVLAVSGGGDSMAMACLASFWAKRTGRRLLAVTVDHGLRPESGDEARRVGTLLAPLGIRHRIVIWEHPPIGGGVQAKAREARYRLLGDVCRDTGAQCMMTAHTADDQAETVAMRILRRSGPDGLAGMTALRDLGGVIHVRPLLSWRRAMLRQVCREAGIGWIEDPSNDDATYTRIAMRRALATQVPDTAEAGTDLTSELLRLGRAMGTVRRHIEQAVLAAGSRYLTIDAAGEAEIAADGLRGLAPAVADRLVARVLTAIGGRGFPVEPAAGARAAALVGQGHDGGPGRGHLSISGCLCRMATGRKAGPFAGQTVLRLVREPGRTTSRMRVAAGDTVLWDNRFMVGPVPVAGWVVARQSLTDLGGTAKEAHLISIGRTFCCGGVRGTGDKLATTPFLSDEAGRPIAAPLIANQKVSAVVGDSAGGAIGAMGGVDGPAEGPGIEPGEVFGIRWAPRIPPDRPAFAVVGTANRII